MMNFGRTPEDFEARSVRHRTWLDGLFTEAVQMVADGLGAEVDGVTSDMTTWIATDDLDTADYDEQVFALACRAQWLDSWQSRASASTYSQPSSS